MRRAAFVYDDTLTQHVLRQDHPLIPRRLRLAYELLQGWNAFGLDNASLVAPRPATTDELMGFHSPAYVAAVEAFARGEQLEHASRFNFSEYGDNPVFPGMYDAALLSTGASVRAADLLVDGSVEAAASFSGGLHHAMATHASGFCVFNDPVIAIQRFLKEGWRVAYIDVDCHHGDGVQEAFYDTDQVLTISLHESGEYLFPGTGFVGEVGTGRGRGYSVNLPLHPFTDDEVYLWALLEVVPPLLEAFRADALVTQLGIDTHFQDPLTHLRLTVQGYLRVVAELGRLSRGRWLALGGGGYNLGAVARGWAGAYGVMLEHPWPETLPATFREQYGIDRLSDDPPPLSPEVSREARHYAEGSVSQLQRLVFPYHGLGGAA